MPDSIVSQGIDGDSLLDVVVYEDPGPPLHQTEAYSREVVQRHSPAQPASSVGYVVLRRPDFKRLWIGLEAGDVYGAAFDILRCVGLEHSPFVIAPLDWCFGWIGQESDLYGRLLILRVYPGTRGPSWN